MVLRKVENHCSRRIFYETLRISEELKPTVALEHCMELNGSRKS